jgi:hypothetical protein
MGGSSKKTTSNTQSASNSSYSSNATNSSTPNVPTWLQTPAMQFASNIGNLQNANPSTYTPQQNTLQLQSQQAAQNLQNPQFTGAYNTLTGITKPGDVQGESVLSNLSSYYNPFQSQVIDPVLQQYDFNAGQTQAQQAAKAAANGAFGSSRYGFQEAQTAQDLAMGRAQTQGGLLSQMYTQAAGMSEADAARRQQADLANQQMAAGYNQTLLGESAQQESLRNAIQENARANQAAQQTAGQQLWNNQVQQQQAPLQYQANLEGLLSGLNPAMYTGQTNTSSASGQSAGTQVGSGTQTEKDSGGISGLIGNLITAVGPTLAKAGMAALAA